MEHRLLGSEGSSRNWLSKPVRVWMSKCQTQERVVSESDMIAVPDHGLNSLIGDKSDILISICSTEVII